jgi:hypothetical protein
MKSKYIVGDLVVYTSLFKEPIAEICEIYEASYLIKFMNGNFAKVTTEEIKPIPLTLETLEKNGWKKDKEDYINDSYHLHLCGKYDGYSVYKVVNDNVVWLTDVRSVSDLQHLLFGLELSSEMEVYV